MSDKATYKIKQTRASQMALEMAKRYGLTLTSGYRDPEHNAKIGGAKNSYHTRGQAYDFSGSKTAMKQFADWARKSGLFVEVLYEVAGHYDHVHVAWKADGDGNFLKDDGLVQKGDKGGIVETIQKLLGGISTDGIFGEETEKAVKRFQEHNGLLVDGIVGKNTWEELTKGGYSVFSLRS
jgi:hypothetical protein